MEVEDKDKFDALALSAVDDGMTPLCNAVDSRSIIDGMPLLLL